MTAPSPPRNNIKLKNLLASRAPSRHDKPSLGVERFKSDAAHLVPLSHEALSLLEALPHFGNGDYLFSATGGEKPVSGLSEPKARLDRHIRNILAAMERARGGNAKAVRLEPFVTHDLRRTMRTRLSSLRVPDAVSEMVIGHGKKGLQRVYDQPRYIEEMRRRASCGRARCVRCFRFLRVTLCG
jgi:integrase